MTAKLKDAGDDVRASAVRLLEERFTYEGLNSLYDRVEAIEDGGKSDLHKSGFESMSRGTSIFGQE